MIAYYDTVLYYNCVYLTNCNFYVSLSKPFLTNIVNYTFKICSSKVIHNLSTAI